MNPLVKLYALASQVSKASPQAATALAHWSPFSMKATREAADALVDVPGEDVAKLREGLEILVTGNVSMRLAAWAA